MDPKLETDILEAINKNLPTQVGQVLVERLAEIPALEDRII